MVWFNANVLVLMLPMFRMNPDGCSVTVLVSVANPGADVWNCADPVPARAWTQKLGIKVVPAFTWTLMLALPALVELFANSTLLASRLVIVTMRFPGGAGAPIEPLTDDWRSFPRVWSPTVIVGCTTVATIDCKLLGVLNPAGVVRPMVVDPIVAGSNAAENRARSPPPNVTGLPTIVPTVVFELVTDTFTVNPPRTACDCKYARLPGASCAASTRSAVFAAPVFVVKLPTFRMKPDGCIVMVPVSLA